MVNFKKIAEMSIPQQMNQNKSSLSFTLILLDFDFTGIILELFPTNVVQTVLVGCVDRSQGKKRF